MTCVRNYLNKDSMFSPGGLSPQTPPKLSDESLPLGVKLFDPV